MNRTIVYVDGFNLYHSVRENLGRRFLWLDIEALSADLMKEGMQLVAVKYFTSRIVRPEESRKRQVAYLEVLATLPRVEIIEGRFKKRTVKCRECGNSWPDDDEKQTDVNIAVAMMDDSCCGSCDVQMLVSGDSDLVPVVKLVSEHDQGIRVLAAFPPMRVCEELKQHADGWFHLSQHKIRRNQLPDRVVLPSGHEVVRPPKYR